MAIVVKCPGCEKKLKLNEPTPGKKIKCPGCKEPFVPVKAKKKAQSGGKPKRKSGPVDDFGDDGFGDDYDEAPQPRRRSGGAKKSNKKKTTAASKSKAPLFIGLGVLGLALAGGLTFMLWPDGDDGGTTAANGEESETGDEGEEGTGEHGDDSGEGGGGAAGAIAGGPPSGGGGAPGAMGRPPGTENAGASSAGSNSFVDSRQGTPAPFDLAMLPPSSEAVAFLDIQGLLEGPLGTLLEQPQIAGPVAQFQQRLGFGPQDIASITIGLGGISEAIQRDAPPEIEQMPLLAVVRTTTSVDTSKLQSQLPGAELATEGDVSYIRVPKNIVMCFWVVDSNTVVIGLESFLKSAIANPSPPKGIDGELLDGKSTIQVAFSPMDAEKVLRGFNTDKLPRQIPKANRELVKSFLASAQSAAISLELSSDIGVVLATRCADDTSAADLASKLTAANEESKAMQAQQSQGMNPLAGLQKQLEESSKIEAVGNVAKSSAFAEGGGTQLAQFVPIAMLGMGALMGNAPTAARGNAPRRTEPVNNLKQIVLGMHNFNSVYNRFPNAVSVDPSGKKLLSWRVHLLGFLGHEDLYNQFNFEEPWDSPTNKPLIAQMPDIYKSPGATLEAGKTVYQVPVGPGTAFEDGKGYGMKDFTDGTVNTILLVEVSPAKAVYWTQPEDWNFDPSSPKDGLGGDANGGFQAAMAAGNVKVIQTSTDDAAVKGMFTRNGAD